MQDYDFWGNGLLSNLLLRQLAYGAQITVMTTPPPGNKWEEESLLERKLRLLEELDSKGADVYVHPHLHAKAYLFQDDKQRRNGHRWITESHEQRLWY